MEKERNEMRKRTTTPTNANKLYVDINELCDIISVGRNTAMKIAKESNASIKFGKRHLYSVERIKNYLDNLGETK